LISKLKEYNQASGVILFILITSTLIIIVSTVDPYIYSGVYLYRDLEFLAGAFIGVLFALKNRKPDQRPLNFGIITGVLGGVLASVTPGIYWAVLYRLSVYHLIVTIGFLCITGLIIGLIIGAILGWFYKNKDMREKEPDDERYTDEFFKDLIED
jgi:hypothetical protein